MFLVKIPGTVHEYVCVPLQSKIHLLVITTCVIGHILGVLRANS